MAASFDLLWRIANDPGFQGRVQYAMAVTAVFAYQEAVTLIAKSATASGNAVLTFAAVPSSVVAGMQIYDQTTPGATAIPGGFTVLSTTATTVTLSGNVGTAGVAAGDTIVFTPAGITLSQHQNRTNLASRVLNGNFLFNSSYVAVLQNTTITGEATNVAPDYGINDGDIQTQVNLMWNAIANA